MCNKIVYFLVYQDVYHNADHNSYQNHSIKDEKQLQTMILYQNVYFLIIENVQLSLLLTVTTFRAALLQQEHVLVIYKYFQNICNHYIIQLGNQNFQK